MTGFGWRPMRAEDVDEVVTLAAIAFPDHFEGRDRFEERLALFPQGCFALASPEGMKGYLIAYPWPFGAIPPLDGPLGSLPESWEALYLHDLALHPDMRGRGLARPIIERLADTVRPLGIGRIALVAVNGSAPFWQSMGFDPVTGDHTIRRKLRSYGDDATYMVREIATPGSG